MNRSRRLAAVISWAITAVVLFGGVGLGVGPFGVALAIADPAAAEPTGGADRSGTHATGSGGGGGSSRPSRQAYGTAAGDGSHHRGYSRPGAARMPPGVVPDEGAEPTEWPWPCHIIWPVWPTPRVPAAGAPGNNIIAGIGVAGPPVPPLAVLSGGVDPKPLKLRIARRLGRAREVANSGLPLPVGARPRVSMTPDARRPAVVPLAGPVMPPAAPTPPAAGGGPTESGRAGYPEYLRDDDVAEVAVVALPGLAGILGITALGGFLGYRQAKVGYILRAAGSARFLQ